VSSPSENPAALSTASVSAPSRGAGRSGATTPASDRVPDQVFHRFADQDWVDRHARNIVEPDFSFQFVVFLLCRRADVIQRDVDQFAEIDFLMQFQR